jgi:hypothetical protein
MTSAMAISANAPVWEGIEPVRLSMMKAAAKRVREIQSELENQGSNVIAEILRDGPEFYEWEHYPPGDVYDLASHSQYYYHAHAPTNQSDVRADEHGHFHTFMRPLGFPDNINVPSDIDGLPAACPSGSLTHLIAVSFNFAGEPIRLFTTNRWVTDETWYPAVDVKQILSQFQVTGTGQHRHTSAWLTTLLRMYGPLIEQLIDTRDHAIRTHAPDMPEHKVWSDQSLEITSFADISLAKDIDALLGIEA